MSNYSNYMTFSNQKKTRKVKTMKKKLLTLSCILVIMLMVNSVAFAMTATELRSLCNLDDAEFISQYLDENTEYLVITEPFLQSDDEVIFDATVVGPNGEKYIIIIVNGNIHIMKA